MIKLTSGTSGVVTVNQKFSRIAVGFIVSTLLLVIACSSDKPVEQTATVGVDVKPTVTATLEVLPTSQTAPAITPTSLPRPTGTPLVVETKMPDVQLETLNVSDIDVEGCRTLTGSSGGNFGTAPGPTATPNASTDSESRQLLHNVDNALFYASISTHIRYWSNDFESNWSYADQPGEQAAILSTLERRLSQLCPSLGPDVRNRDGISEIRQLSDSLKIRYSWVRFALQELMCCGDAHTQDIESGRMATSDAILSADRLFSGVVGSIYTGDPIVIDSINVLATNEEGWVNSPVSGGHMFLAPTEFQVKGLLGFGPSNWSNGTAVRIRRFRNPSPISLEEAAERFGGIALSYGEFKSIEEANLLRKKSHRITVEDEELSWRSVVEMVVLGEHTYIVDSGCPMSNSGACDAIDDYSRTLRVVGYE